MTICTPETDWGCAYTAEELAEMRADLAKLQVMERSEAFAWGTLAALTAYRIGTCPIVVRPCARGCKPAGTWIEAPLASSGQIPVATIGRAFSPHIEGGVWVNSCGCGAGEDCSCVAVSEVILPGPVGHIEEVVVDGVIIDPKAYRVDNGNRLVRQDGGVWPLCQDMNLVPGQEGTFTVEYYQGAAPNEITRYAAGVLAAEYYKGCQGAKGCRLPRNVKAVNRAGASIELEADFMESLALWPEIAPVIAMFNPHRLKTAPRVLSPGGPGRVRRTTWGHR